MANIGYARVSAADQDYEAQVERLQAAGCARVFAEKASGKSMNGRHEHKPRVPETEAEKRIRRKFYQQSHVALTADE